MTPHAGRCPNCGAPIEFSWSKAVQTTCAHCRSVVVRHDIDLASRGEVSDIPEDSSPIRVGAEGRVDDVAFRVVGRIVYEHDDGAWNEWHLVFDDQASGWLSDAQAEYAVSRLVRPELVLPQARGLSVGTPLRWRDLDLRVTSLTRARYRGVEGELPFEYWGKEDVLFADLRSHAGAFGTIDYSETPPLLFVGRYVEYDDLALRNTRQFAGW